MIMQSAAGERGCPLMGQSEPPPWRHSTGSAHPASVFRGSGRVQRSGSDRIPLLSESEQADKQFVAGRVTEARNNHGNCLFAATGESLSGR